MKMKHLTKHIIALLLIVSLTVGFSGIEIFHHVCSTTGIHIISILGEKDCPTDKHRNIKKEKIEVLQDNEKSCCSEKTESEIPSVIENQVPCCSESEQDNDSKIPLQNGSSFDSKCCNNFIQIIALDDIFVVTDFLKDKVYQPLIAAISDNPAYTDLSARYKLLAKKIPKFIRFPDKLIRFIHLITNHNSGDKSDEPSFVF